MRRRPIGIALLVALLPALLLAARLAAHGMGKPQVLNEPAGPYLVSVWTDPDPLRADETHVVVGVTDPATRQPIVTGIAGCVHAFVRSITDGVPVAIPVRDAFESLAAAVAADRAAALHQTTTVPTVEGD